MLGESPDTLFTLAQGYLGPLLPVDVLHYQDGAVELVVDFVKRGGAHARPAL